MSRRSNSNATYDLSTPLSDLLIVGGYAIPAERPPRSREAAIKAIANAVVAPDPAPRASRPDEPVVAHQSPQKRTPSGTAPRRERRAAQRADRRKASRSGRRAADPVPQHLDSTVTKSQKKIGMARSASERAKTGSAESEAAPEIARSIQGQKEKR